MIETAKKWTEDCEVGKVVGTVAPGVTCRYIAVVLIVTEAARITHKHAEGFDCSRQEVEAYVRQMMDEAQDYARAQYLELLERDRRMLAEFQGLLDQANA